jgi:hypothetical protein
MHIPVVAMGKSWGQINVNLYQLKVFQQDQFSAEKFLRFNDLLNELSNRINNNKQSNMFLPWRNNKNNYYHLCHRFTWFLSLILFAVKGYPYKKCQRIYCETANLLWDWCEMCIYSCSWAVWVDCDWSHHSSHHCDTYLRLHKCDGVK